MKNILIYALLIILIVLSLFTGLSINGNFSYLYEFAFVSFPEIIISNWHSHRDSLNIFQYIHWMLTVIAHIGVIILHFIYFKFKSRKLLIYIPLAFLVMQFFILAIFIFILIPFAIVWLIALVLSSKIADGYA